MEGMFNFKDFEKVKIKATYDIEVGNRKIQPGETIVVFDKIQIAGIDGISRYVTAHGGFDDRARVFWETQREETLKFSQGVFSKEQLALLTNSRFVVESEEEVIEISEREFAESDEDSLINLKHTPIRDLFLYDAESYEQITNYTIEDNIITLVESPFKSVIVDYIYDYNNDANIFKFGQNLITGYVELEGRTRVKDDTTGHVVTGIIKIPRLKLMSNLSIRLGANAVPMVGTFSGTAVPVGSRGSTYITEFYILSDDIDSDL